jgi:hypothetical protein
VLTSSQPRDMLAVGMKARPGMRRRRDMPVEQFLGCTRRLQFKTANAGRQLFTVAFPLRNQAKIISHVSVAEREGKTRHREREKVFSFLRSQTEVPRSKFDVWVACAKTVASLASFAGLEVRAPQCIFFRRKSGKIQRCLTVTRN